MLFANFVPETLVSPTSPANKALLLLMRGLIPSLAGCCVSSYSAALPCPNKGEVAWSEAVKTGSGSSGGEDRGSGIGRTMKCPIIIGHAVPTARINRNEDVSPGKKIREMKENRNADSPNPDMTKPTVVARCFTSAQAQDVILNTHSRVWKRFRCRIDGTGKPRITAGARSEPKQHQ